MPSAELQFKQVAIASLLVHGYSLDELEVWTKGNQVFVKGNHKCAYEDSCVVTEFQQIYTLPKHVDAKSIRVKMENHKLMLRGLFRDPMLATEMKTTK